jgi:hypothetical protein
MTVGEFFGTVKEAGFTFTGIFEWIKSLFTSLTENAGVIDIWQFITNAYNSYIIPISLVLITVSLAIAFYGRRISGIIKFIFFFLIGFAVGVNFLSPVIPESIKLDSWIIGLIVAVVVAVLYKYLYYVLLVVAVGYSVYRISYTGFFITATAQYTAGKALVSLLIALALAVAAIIFNSWVERVITASLGGYLAATVFNAGIWNYTSLPFLAGIEWVGILVISATVGLLGLYFQIIHREVY